MVDGGVVKEPRRNEIEGGEVVWHQNDGQTAALGNLNTPS